MGIASLRRLWRNEHPNLPRRNVSIAPRLIGGLALLVALGTLLLLLSSAGSARPLRFNEALFTATSALTVTGLSIITPSRDLTFAGQIILLLLIQIGGVGYMAFAVIAFRLIGRNVNLMDRIALRDSLGLLDLGNIVRLVWRVLLTVLALQAVGALLLWLHWRDGPLGEGRTAFYALFHAISAFNNAGFDLFSQLPDYPAGIPTDNGTLLIKGVLIFLGGLGIPILADLITWPKNRRLSLHTRITLVVVVVLICIGGFGLLLSEARAGGVLAGVPGHRQIILTFFQSVSARTAGFAGLPLFETLDPASQHLLVLLMFIGSSPASMGGGITTGTFVVLILALWGHARGFPNTRISRRRIPTETVRKASAVLTVALLVTSLSTWLILLTHPQATLDRALFEVVSAFATCGLSLAFTSELNGFGQAIIMAVMFWGRLGALTIVVALAQQRAPDPLTYPEEQVLIG